MIKIRPLFIFALLCLCLLSTVGYAAQNDNYIYLYGTLERESMPVGSSLFGEHVVLSREWNKGIINKKHYTLFVVKCAASEIANYEKIGFKRLESMKVNLNWLRISNINGWGTAVNGEVSRRINDVITASKTSEIPKTFEKIDSYLKDNLAILKSTSPNEYNILMSPKPAKVFERGFTVQFSIVITVEKPLVNEKTLLFEKSVDVGYYSL